MGITNTSYACFYNQDVKELKAHGDGSIHFQLGNEKRFTLIDDTSAYGGRSEYKLLLMSMATGMKLSGATDSISDCNNHLIKSLTLHTD